MFQLYIIISKNFWNQIQWLDADLRGYYYLSDNSTSAGINAIDSCIDPPTYALHLLNYCSDWFNGLKQY